MVNILLEDAWKISEDNYEPQPVIVGLRRLRDNSRNDLRIERVLNLSRLARKGRRLAADGQSQRVLMEEMARIDDLALGL